MTTARRFFTLASLVVLGTTMANCKALQRTEGDACTRKFDVTCVGAKGALICDGSRMVTVVCRSRKGAA